MQKCRPLRNKQFIKNYLYYVYTLITEFLHQMTSITHHHYEEPSVSCQSHTDNLITLCSHRFFVLLLNYGNCRKKQHLREIMLRYFVAKKTLHEIHCLLVYVYGDDASSRITSFEWFKRFKRGDFDKERPSQEKKNENDVLETRLSEDYC